MEIKGVVERVEKKHIEKLKKDIFTVLVNGKSYQCWSELKEGQELPSGATIKEAPEGTSFLPTIIVPKAANEKKPYGGGVYKAQFTDIQAKVMLMSYAKDAVCKMLDVPGKHHSPNEVGEAIVSVFKNIESAVFHTVKTDSNEVSSDEIPF